MIKRIINLSASLAIAFIIAMPLSQNLLAQGKKSPLTLDDIWQWRTHTATLSDDGEWYTVLYSLEEETDLEVDSIAIKKAEDYFTEDNQTDVLYISSVADGIKYRIEDGSKPKFSSTSEWIAYRVKPEEEEEEGDDPKALIELKHLATGFTVQYESEAGYEFIEEQPYFVTKDEKSLLIYDLEQRTEHYIGSVGEFLLDKDSEFIAYTISTKDRRGNGIYLYNPSDRTTKALVTGAFDYSNLSWNKDNNTIAAYKFRKDEDEVDSSTISLLTMKMAEVGQTELKEFPADQIQGISEKMMLAPKTTKSANSLIWSNDDERLFVKLKNKKEEGDSEAEEDESNDESTVQVWHWKDKKLLSQRIMEHDDKEEQVYHAIFFLESNNIKQITDNEYQELSYSEGTDNWAILRDYSNYISDWDVPKSDISSVNLKTGDIKLIRENHSGSYYSKNYYISPNGDMMVYWDGEDYWSYTFAEAKKINLTSTLSTSFMNEDYDKYGYSPDYGFIGWVKDQNAVLVEHEFDLWILPTDKASDPLNLTINSERDSTRFRIEDYSFQEEDQIEDRYIDLSEPLVLNAFNERTKYAGFYSLSGGNLIELIYEPASFAKPWRSQTLVRSEDSETIIYNRGNYQEFPESYLSNLSFSSSQKITTTNPQQKEFKWGERILIDYTNDDGVPLQAVLSIPDSYKKGQKLPMVVYSYEKMSYAMYRYPFPWVSGGSVPEMLLVSNDYLYLRPDIHFNVGTPHSDMHECIDAAIEKVIELGYVDAERIGYQGFSFGGHCGMYISTQENKFAAIAAGAGVSNLVQGFNIDIVRNGSNEQDYYMVGQGRLGTDPTSDTEMYISESPVFNAQTMETPLLLYHGTDDRVVQWEHSFGFYSILRYLKKPVILVSYRGEGHGMDEHPNRMDLQQRLAEFFDHYLKDAEAKDWMTQETPYVPEEKSDDDKEERTVPKWK